MTLGGKKTRASKSNGDIQLIVRVFTTARHVWHDTALTCPTTQQRPNDTPDRVQPTCIHHYTDDNGSYLECGTKKNYRINAYIYYIYIYYIYIFLSPLGINVDWEVKGRGGSPHPVHSFKIRKEKEKQCIVLVYCDRDLWENTKAKCKLAGFWNKCGRNGSLFYDTSSTSYIGEARIALYSMWKKKTSPSSNLQMKAAGSFRTSPVHPPTKPDDVTTRRCFS